MMSNGILFPRVALFDLFVTLFLCLCLLSIGYSKIFAFYGHIVKSIRKLFAHVDGPPAMPLLFHQNQVSQTNNQYGYHLLFSELCSESFFYV